MRILSIHVDTVWYRTTRKTKVAEDIGPKEDRVDECVVLFSCVEKLDEQNPSHVVASAVKNIIARLRKLKVNRVLIYPYAHLTSTLGSPECALAILKSLEKELCSAAVDVKRAPFGWNKEFEIHSKGHPLAELSMTICPYEKTECNFRCPYCKNPVNETDLEKLVSATNAASNSKKTFAGFEVSR
ncbi:MULTISPECIES: threonyl-tRNA synthetase editing domain-containing protein [unclassified Methanoculleus]|jgi:threonyl-tRNA synthetase|uniref:threonyl-tRNA synthetase editing domain-containing protein n=1 Tax=unclassified Methanoculleus TaxID=2619537 RepID=UPI0025F3D8D5|nr:threonyl-tRNA synthetase editing domain-containing protein [Methanoculleus sp. UBA377]